MYETSDSLTKYLPEKYSRAVQFAQIGKQTRIEELHFGDVHDAHSPSPSLHIGSVDVQQSSP